MRMQDRKFPAALAGVLAVLGLGSAVPSPSGDTPPAAHEHAGHARAPPPEPPETGRARQLLEEQFFDGRGSPSLGELAHRYDLDVLIATLPDPAVTGQDWSFKSRLDALQRAFEQAGFAQVRAWAPWKDTGAVWPGVLVFRSSEAHTHELRVLYLVGESPNAGVQQAALRVALEERRTLLDAFAEHPPTEETPGDIVTIVGPTYSSGAASLLRALEGWRADGGRSQARFVVATGSATRLAERDVLDRPWLRFVSTIRPDGSLLAVLRHQILPGLGIAPDRVALLHESATLHGQAVAADPAVGGFVLQPYPMGIAAMRTASADTTPASSDAVDHHGAPTLDLAAGPLAPHAAAAMFDEFVHLVGRRGIRLVLIAGLDVRDKLFLASEIGRRVPDVQLAALGGNVLYASTRLKPALHGALMLSTYPLAPHGLTPRGREWVAFPDDGAQGTFNAALLLLDEADRLADYIGPCSNRPVGEPLVQGEDDRLADHIGPGSNRPVGEPPVWVTSVGKHALVPVRAFPGRAGTATDHPIRVPTDSVPTTRRPVGLLAFGFTIVLGLGLLIPSAMSLRWKAEPDLRLAATAPAPDCNDSERYRRVEALSIVLHRWIFRSFLFLGLGLAYAPAATVVTLGEWVSEPASPLLISACVLSMAGLGVALLRLLWLTSRVLLAEFKEGWGYAFGAHWTSSAQRRAWWLELLGRAVTVAVVLAVVAFQVRFAWQCVELARQDKHTFALFYARALEVASGLSPLVPLALIGAGWALWALWHLRRLELLEPVPMLEAAWWSDASTRGRALQRVRAGLFREVTDGGAAILGLLLIIGGTWTVTRPLGTLESIVFWTADRRCAFDVALRLGILAALAAIPWATYRLVATWLALRGVLDTIKTSPLLSALERLPQRVARLTMMSFWPLERDATAAAVARAQWEHLVRLPAPTDVSLKPRTTTAPPFDVLWSLLEAAWQRDPAPQLEAAAKALASPEAKRSTSGWLRRSFEGPDGVWLRLAEEHAAVRVVEYVHAVVLQLRTLAVFLLASLLITTLLLSAYPFQSQGLLKLVFGGIMVAAVAAVLLLLLQANRDEVLSRIAKSQPGQLTWDVRLIANVLLFGLLPLTTLLSSEFPQLYSVFFAWVDPLLKALTAF